MFCPWLKVTILHGFLWTQYGPVLCIQDPSSSHDIGLVASAGVVHWTPPDSALDLASDLVRDRSISAYGPCAGLPVLTDVLKEKLATENGLPEVPILENWGLLPVLCAGSIGYQG